MWCFFELYHLQFPPNQIVEAISLGEWGLFIHHLFLTLEKVPSGDWAAGWSHTPGDSSMGHWVWGLLGLASRRKVPWRPSPTQAGFTPSDWPSIGATGIYVPYSLGQRTRQGKWWLGTTPGAPPQNSPISDGVPLPWKTKPRPLDFGWPTSLKPWSEFTTRAWKTVSGSALFPMWSRVNH